MSRSDGFDTSVSSAIREDRAARRRRRPTAMLVIQSRYGHPWRMEAVVTEQDGRLVVAEVKVVHSPLGHLPGKGPLPRGGLTASDLRKFSLPEIIDTAASDERWFLEKDPTLSHLGPRERDRLREAMRGGQGRAKNDDLYGYFAEKYLQALRNHPTRPYASMRRLIRSELGQDFPPSTLRNRVRRAREYGWLTDGTPSRAGGKPTAKLRRRRRSEREK
jgi:hypothetical protein